MRKTLISTRTVLLAVLALLLCVAMAAALLLSTTAQAYTSSAIETGTNMVKIGEIFKDNATTGGAFDRDNLQKLINELAKVYGGGIKKDSQGNVDVDDLRNKVLGSSTAVGTQTFNNTQRINNINNNAIIVQFGGITWLASFMSLADTNLADASDTYSGIGSVPTEGSGTDLVLTLWQAVPNGDDSAKWVGDANGYGNDDTDSQGTSPANMYGVSHLRAVTLNNGGQYATSKDQNKNTETKATQSKDNKYAKFTMMSYTGSDSNEWKSNIASFLVAPRFIDWQKTQHTPSTWNWPQKDKCDNSDAWGVMGSDNYYNSSIYYENLDNYTQWKDDLVWIPSCPEVGNEYNNNENTGMWGLTEDQRAYNTGSASEYLWLRTCRDDRYYHAYGLTCEGVLYYDNTSESRLVRPALHLNLTAAAAGIDKPTSENGSNSKTVTYNGQKQSFNLGLATELATGDGKKVDVVITQNDNNDGAIENIGGNQVFTATKSGTYKVTLTPTEGNHWKNPDKVNDTDPIEFTLIIQNAKITLSGFNLNQSFTYSLSGIDTPVKHKMEVPTANIVTAGSQTPTVRYSALTTERNSNDYSGDSSSGYTVWKAGQYSATVTITADYHDEFRGTLTFTIDKATPTVNATCDMGTVYTNRSLPALTYTATVDGYAVYGDISWLTALDSVTVSGKYNFAWKWVSNDDSIVEATGQKELTVEVVNNAILRPTAPSLTTAVYDGTQRTVDLVSDRDKDKLDIVVTEGGGYAEIKFVDGRWVLAATKAGTYTVTLTPKSDCYWDGVDDSDRSSVTLTLQIDKRQITLRAVVPSGTATTIVYGERFVLTGNARDYWTYADTTPYEFLRENDAMFTVICDAANSGSLPVPDKYSLTLTFDGDSSNYDVKFVGSVTVEVVEAEIDLSAIENDFNQSYTYGFVGNAKTPLVHTVFVDTARIKVVNNQVITVTYRNASSSLAGALQDNVYKVSNAGVYSVDVEISAPYHKTVTRTVTVTILKATAVVMPTCDRQTPILTSGNLPELTCTATVGGVSVEGIIRWTKSLGSVSGSGLIDFDWEWVPVDSNIEIARGAERLNISFVGVRAININFDAGDRVFYDTDSLNDLKNYLTVTIQFTDNTQKVLAMNEYTLTCQGGMSLVAGDSVGVTVSYIAAGSPITQSFKVSVVATEKPVDPDPVDPDPKPVDPEPVDPSPADKSVWEKMLDWAQNTPLPLGYAAVTIGAELLLIIILAIVARKPKHN